MLCEQRLSERPPGGSPLDESIPSQHIQNKIHTYQNVSTVLTVSLVCLYTHIPVIPNLEHHNHIHVWHPSLPSYQCSLCMCSIWGYCHNFIPSKCKSFIRIFHFALVLIFLIKYGSYYLRHLWPSKQTNHNKMGNCESAAFCGEKLTPCSAIYSQCNAYSKGLNNTYKWHISKVFNNEFPLYNITLTPIVPSLHSDGQSTSLNKWRLKQKYILSTCYSNL
jgi:hypothetical protein